MLGSINLLGLFVVVLSALLFGAFAFLARQGFKPTLRPLSGYETLPGQVGQAVESGGRVHVSLGPNSIIDKDTGTALAGLAMLDIISATSAISDRSPVASTSDATTLPVISDTIRRAYARQDRLDMYETTAARLVALDPVALAGGVTSIIADDDVRTNVLIGSFGPETALIAEAGERRQVPQVIGSDRLEGQAAAYVMADHALIGEEIFVSRAYLTEDPFAISGLTMQDVARGFVIAAIVIGMLLKTFGLL